jgi:predicted transcriptional regulator
MSVEQQILDFLESDHGNPKSAGAVARHTGIALPIVEGIIKELIAAGHIKQLKRSHGDLYTIAK